MASSRVFYGHVCQQRPRLEPHRQHLWQCSGHPAFHAASMLAHLRHGRENQEEDKEDEAEEEEEEEEEDTSNIKHRTMNLGAHMTDQLWM